MSDSSTMGSSKGGTEFSRRPRLIQTLSRSEWITLAVSLPTIACLALGAHDVAISRLGIPFPYQAAAPWWYGVVNNAVRIGALVVLYDLSSWYFRERSYAVSMFAFGMLMVFLYETLRAISVDLAVVEGWVDSRWMYMVLDRFPAAILAFAEGAVAVAISRAFERAGRGWTLLAIAICGLMAALIVLPELKHFVAAIDRQFGLTQPPEIHQPPYGLNIYSVIYVTFIEPTCASFVYAALVWPGLRGGKVRKVLTFTLLILLIRARVVAVVLYPCWVEQPYWTALLSEGQFFVETLIMAGLTGCVWAHVSGPQTRGLTAP